MKKVTGVWRNKRFRRVWGAGAVSTLGVEIGELAIPVLALVTLGASAAELSFVRAALLVPYLLLTLWLGVLVDRARRRPLMIAADIGRGVLLGVVCWFAIAGWLTVPLLILAAALVGSLTVVYALAEFAFLPVVVAERDLLDANAGITATQSAIGIAGAGAGGALVQLITAPVAIGVNAVGYLVSGALIAGVRTREEPRPVRRRSAWRESRDGLRVLLRHPVLRSLVAEASIWNFGNEIFMIALAVLVLQDLQLGAAALGLILMSGGAGAFLGSICARLLTDRFGYGSSLTIALVLGNTAPLVGVLFATVASWTSVLALAGAFFVSGAGIGVATSQAVGIRQLAVDPGMRGRVNAGYRLASWGFLAIGAIAGGALVTFIGAWAGAVAGTAVMALATAAVAASPTRRIREIDEIIPRSVATERERIGARPAT